MSDLIDRQDLINGIYNDNPKDVLAYIAEFPSAQPEIIRCRDCVKQKYCRTSSVWAVAPSDDWFCADSERRTDE